VVKLNGGQKCQKYNAQPNRRGKNFFMRQAWLKFYDIDSDYI